MTNWAQIFTGLLFYMHVGIHQVRVLVFANYQNYTAPLTHGSNVLNGLTRRCQHVVDDICLSYLVLLGVVASNMVFIVVENVAWDGAYITYRIGFTVDTVSHLFRSGAERGKRLTEPTIWLLLRSFQMPGFNSETSSRGNEFSWKEFKNQGDCTTLVFALCVASHRFLLVNSPLFRHTFPLSIAPTMPSRRFPQFNTIQIQFNTCHSIPWVISRA